MASRILLVLVALVAVAAAESVNFTYSFNGGLPFCSQCGGPGLYACSPDKQGSTIGNWNSGIINFYDPVPSNGVPHGMKIQLYGAYSCDATVSSAMMGFTLNGNALSVRDTPYGQVTNPCKCETCDTSDSVTFNFRNGLPTYYKGMSNRLQINLYRNNICLNRVVVTIDYVSTRTELPHYYLPIKNFKPHNTTQTCLNCNNGQVGESTWCSALNANVLSFTFSDPLPTGAILVGVDVDLSYNLVQRATTRLTTATYSLTGTQVGVQTVAEQGWRNQCGCTDNYMLQSVFYQRGWPSYTYRGSNTFTISISKYSEYYGNVCYGRIGLDLIYYTSDDMNTLKYHHMI